MQQCVRKGGSWTCIGRASGRVPGGNDDSGCMRWRGTEGKRGRGEEGKSERGSEGKRDVMIVPVVE
jgi:hypothetical protein